MTTELRFSPAIELRLEERPGRLPLIVGYAVVYNSLSKEIRLGEHRSFREVIRSGAFTKSLASGNDVIARFEHSTLLGRVSNGTLRLFQDARGVRYEIDPADTSAGRDAVALIRRGDVRGSSFGMNVPPDGDNWRQDRSGLIREIRSANLVEVSPVSKPAYEATDATLRSFMAAKVELSNSSRKPSLRSMRLELAERCSG